MEVPDRDPVLLRDAVIGRMLSPEGVEQAIETRGWNAMNDAVALWQQRALEPDEDCDGMRRSPTLHQAWLSQTKGADGWEENEEWTRPWPLRSYSTSGDVAGIRCNAWMILLITVVRMCDYLGDLRYSDSFLWDS